MWLPKLERAMAKKKERAKKAEAQALQADEFHDDDEIEAGQESGWQDMIAKKVTSVVQGMQGAGDTLTKVVAGLNEGSSGVESL